MTDTKAQTADWSRLGILAGGGDLPLELARGVDGPMAGFSYPEMLSGVYRLHTQGDTDAANDLFERYLRCCATRRWASGAWRPARRSCGGAAPSVTRRCASPDPP